MFVRPILEYACVARSPYHQSNAYEQLEWYNDMLLDMHRTSMIDMQANVLEMISILGWPTLESRCNTLRTLMMHKIMNNL